MNSKEQHAGRNSVIIMTFIISKRKETLNNLFFIGRILVYENSFVFYDILDYFCHTDSHGTCISANIFSQNYTMF